MNSIDTLPIVETFHSVQGEGYWAGTNAFFIRLAGCDVGCKWCDQKESWPTRYPKINVSAIATEVKTVNPAIVVITGGEPLMHNLTPLTSKLKGVRRHIETSGVYPLTGELEWVTLSPKPHAVTEESLCRVANELKVVIARTEDFAFAEEMSDRVAPDCHLFLQPCWGKGMESVIFDYTLKNPQWRISLQTHKYLKIR